MFTPRSYAVHAPALSLHEAAMLPALEASPPRNLLLPDHRTYTPVLQGGQSPAQPRRGSMAGRAVLTYIKSAPAKRPGR